MGRSTDKGPKPTFIWDSYGDWQATLLEGFIWDPAGNWIGWVEEVDKKTIDVYKTDGEWIGNLSKDGRIIRKRTTARRPLVDVPAKPAKPSLPARAPLPPPFAELSYSDVDVLEEDPDIFKKISDMRPDMQ